MTPPQSVQKEDLKREARNEFQKLDDESWLTRHQHVSPAMAEEFIDSLIDRISASVREETRKQDIEALKGNPPADAYIDAVLVANKRGSAFDVGFDFARQYFLSALQKLSGNE